MRLIRKRNHDWHRLTRYTLSELIAVLQDIQKQYGDIRVEGDLDDWNTSALGLDLTVCKSTIPGKEITMDLCPFVLYGEGADEDENDWEKVK